MHSHITVAQQDINALFQFFPFQSLKEQIWSRRKIGLGITSPECYIPSFKNIGPVAVKKEDFVLFYYHIW